MKRYFSLLLLMMVCAATVHPQITTLSGEIDNLKNDTIKIILQINNITRQSETHTIPVNNGKFTDTLQITRPVYFYTKEDTNYVTGLIQPGDRITILGFPATCPFFPDESLPGFLLLLLRDAETRSKRTKEKTFDNLIATVSDDLLSYCKKASPECDSTKQTCKVSATFFYNNSGTGFDYCVNGTINDLPKPIKEYITNTKKITDPWYQTQKETIKKNNPN